VHAGSEARLQEVTEHGLKSNAIGFRDALIIGIASTAPAYSLARVFGGTAPEGSLVPEVSWFSPFAIDSSSALIGGLLIGVFIYCGWESSVNLTEETQNSETAPGLAAVASTVVLLVTYLSVAAAVVAFGGVGTAEKFADDDAILSTLATGVLGSPGASYTGGSFLGPGVPLVIGVGFLLLGAILMVLWRLGDHEGFFGRTPETVDPEVAAGRVRVRETAGAPPEEC
jgi:amino acid transporter